MLRSRRRFSVSARHRGESEVPCLQALIMSYCVARPSSGGRDKYDSGEQLDDRDLHKRESSKKNFFALTEVIVLEVCMVRCRQCRRAHPSTPIGLASKFKTRFSTAVLRRQCGLMNSASNSVFPLPLKSNWSLVRFSTFRSSPKTNPAAQRERRRRRDRQRARERDHRISGVSSSLSSLPSCV